MTGRVPEGANSRQRSALRQQSRQQKKRMSTCRASQELPFTINNPSNQLIQEWISILDYSTGDSCLLVIQYWSEVNWCRNTRAAAVTPLSTVFVLVSSKFKAFI
ncbi:hypothetical protein M378DRAFT_19029 [Amanita muscaria Koide BX008]|uniref:Uncharacterized protein n=1 Tax=Amanita muscaria (strain Koide BX008) TaxID=946122 RepID=A0A0C2WCJ3_AMAMK|nr:hypothetical protein M378DRAFT_19029 [Amanita muscaria Koide BX008]